MNPSQFEHTMNMIALVSAQDPTANLLGEGDEVAAFVGNEIRHCQGHLHSGFAILYAFHDSLFKQGGENLTFKFF